MDQAEAVVSFLRRWNVVVIIDVVVGIAQLAEHRTVAPTVAGSIPVSHPRITLPLRQPQTALALPTVEPDSGVRSRRG
jgi:hypothetical protein